MAIATGGEVTSAVTPVKGVHPKREISQAQKHSLDVTALELVFFAVLARTRCCEIFEVNADLHSVRPLWHGLLTHEPCTWDETF